MRTSYEISSPREANQINGSYFIYYEYFKRIIANFIDFPTKDTGAKKRTNPDLHQSPANPPGKDIYKESSLTGRFPSDIVAPP